MILNLFLTFVPIFTAIILHEIAHGYVAHLFGDDTALKKGRLSINPLHHIDLFGTLILPACLWLAKAGFIFGWARPVPVNPYNLKNHPRDDVLVAAAGIIMNLALAIISALLLFLSGFIGVSYLRGVISLFFVNMIIFNVGLAVFNSIPIPPLDGSKILFGWINKPWARAYLNSEKYGLMAMVLLLFVLPAIGSNFGFNLNIIRDYIIIVTRFICSFLM